MPNLTLTADSRPGKYGLVRVYEPDGVTVCHEYRITARDLKQLHRSGSAMPHGCTKHWHRKDVRAVVLGYDFDNGDAEEKRGVVTMRLGDWSDERGTHPVFVRLSKKSYHGTFPRITAFEYGVAEINAQLKDRQIVSLVDGVVEFA